MGQFKFYQPGSLEDLLTIKKDLGKNAVILAGGSNVLVYIKEGSILNGTLVDIKSLESLKGITENNDVVEIGAAETIADLLESPLLSRKIPFFAESLKSFANPLVRNKATLGGNLADASPIGDTIPPLMVLNAQIEAASTKGRRMIPIEELFTGPGQSSLKPEEVIRVVKIPVPEKGSGAFNKLGLRKGTSCSVASVAVWLILEDKKVEEIRIACGGVAPTPFRAVKTERLYKGKRLDPETAVKIAGELMNEITPITDVRASVEYRKEVTPKLLLQAVRGAAGMEE